MNDEVISLAAAVCTSMLRPRKHSQYIEWNDALVQARAKILGINSPKSTTGFGDMTDMTNPIRRAIGMFILIANTDEPIEALQEYARQGEQLLLSALSPSAQLEPHK